MADKILIGPNRASPLFTFPDADIKICDCVLSSGLLMDELAVDELRPTVYSAAYIRVRFAPKNTVGLKTADGKIFMVLPGTGYLDQLPYGTPIWYYSGDVLIGKFYSKRVVRSGKTWFDIQAVSAIGILDGQSHNGNIYTGQTFAAVAAEIIGSAASFSIAEDVASIPVFGWLPKASRRANLHQLLFAFGATITKDTDGNMVIFFPGAQTPKHISDDRIFIGGSVDYQTPASRVDITEHSFINLPTDDLVTLFDNTDGSGIADHTTVDFQAAPIHDITTSGDLIIHESGVNYAVLSGTGILTGRKYTHTTKIISLDNRSVSEDKTVSVTDATLVTVTNSEYVARRVLSFYSSARTVSADIVVDGEKPGDQINFNNPFESPETAFLASMDMHSGSFLRAACELITNYTPKWFGNQYTRVMVFTQSGTVTIPADSKGTIRAVLISGAEGGSSGEDGASPTYPDQRNWTSDTGRRYAERAAAPPAKGGEAGSPGAGGRILTVTIAVKPLQTLPVVIGTGGIGGLASDGPDAKGKLGTDTTFAGYSTKDGRVSRYGYLDPISNEIYATSGKEGVPGGSGGGMLMPNYEEVESESVSIDGQIFAGGTSIGRAQRITAERGTVTGTYGYMLALALGGYGGGAAFGAPGRDGTTNNWDASTTSSGVVTAKGADGGDGANAVKPSKPSIRGTGGGAGHGGGGAGSGGGSQCENAGGANDAKLITNIPQSGKPGKGSDGGDGADGVLLIYY